jgi:hypothetical protein
MTVITDYQGALPPEQSGGRDIPQMPGFPITVGGSMDFMPMRGLVFDDLDLDGDLDIIVSSTDYRIYAWDYTGAAMPGFPITTIEMPQYAPSVADMDGDGDLEIVQFTRGVSSGGRLYVLDHLGNVLPGFPVSLNNNNVTSCPTLYDLDDDGCMEIIAGEREWPIGRLHIVEIDGSEWGGNWPLTLDHVPASSASVGDVDADGEVEIFYLSYASMHLLEVDGTPLPGWPAQIPNSQFSYQSAALADLDDDDDLEIVVGAHYDGSGCYVFHHDATLAQGWPRLFDIWTYCPPTVTDLEGDGELEIIDGYQGVPIDNAGCFYVWDYRGRPRSGFPYRSGHGYGSNGPLTVADVNGDGIKEIFADHNITIDDRGFLFGVDASGNDLPGFPLRPLGWTYMNGAAIADVDGDGDCELGVLSSHETGVDVNLYDLPDQFQLTSGDWPTYHGRNSRGGLYSPSAPIPGDLNGDGCVDQADLGILLADWGCTGGDCPGDCDGDGDTDQSDVGILLSHWGEGCP